jgi:predicted dehydrogenase
LNDAEKLTKKRPEGFTDLRKVLEDKSIDAISIATPNRNHALQAIWGCQAGKDVYIEKPCAYKILEAKRVATAAAKYNRMVQRVLSVKQPLAVSIAKLDALPSEEARIH